MFYKYFQYLRLRYKQYRPYQIGDCRSTIYTI